MKIITKELRPGRSDVRLTGYIAEADPIAYRNDKRPGVLVLPGGAYYGCDKESAEGDPVALSFAADGFQAFVLEYSVIGRAPKGEALFPAQLFDVARALEVIKENSDEWAADPDKIVIAGFSAGAHLAALYCSRWHDGVVPGAIKPACAILGYGYYDYRETFKKYYDYMGIDIDDPSGAADRISKRKTPPMMRMQEALFGTRFPDGKAMDEFSPFRHISDKMPPAFLFAAADDDMVDPGSTLRMAERLHGSKVPCEVHLFRNGGHGFGIGRNIDEPYLREKAYSASAWVDLAKEFIMNVLSPATAEKNVNEFTKRMGKVFESNK